LHALAARRQQFRDGIRSRVSDAEPDHLGRMAPEEAELAEVIVLGDEGRAVARSVLPQLQVRLPLEPDKFNVFALGIRSFESTDQPATEVLVEQQAHAR